MTSNPNNGREIKQVFWPVTEPEKGRCLVADGYGCGRLTLACEYHGDHDEDWIIETRNGVEVARHNVRYVETIQWSDAPMPNEKAEGAK
jgi:hypothetical protein